MHCMHLCGNVLHALVRPSDLVWQVSARAWHRILAAIAAMFRSLGNGVRKNAVRN